MIRIVSSFFTILALSACNDDSPSATTQTSPGGIEYTLLYLPDHEDVAIQIAWASDWSYRADTAKAAPFIGTQLMLAGGAQGYAPGEVGERFADLNSEGNIYNLVNDHVVGEIVFEQDAMAETIETANAHLRAPTLDQVWFERIRDGFSQNITEAAAQPAQAGFDAVRWAVLGEQPVRNALSLDDPATFTDLSRDDIVDWHQETFTRNPQSIVVAGTLDAALAGDAVDQLLDGLTDFESQITLEAQPDYSPKRILLHMPDDAVSNLVFVAPLPSTRLGGEFEDLLIMHALGGDDQSVLFDAVRTQLRATYGFGAGMANYSREHRIIAMSGEVETEKLAKAEQAVRDAYAAFRNNGLRGNLDDRKIPLEGTFSTLSDFVVDQAHSELQSALDGSDVGRSLSHMDVLAAVTDDSITQRLRTAYPQIDDFIVIAVSPDAGALPGACVITTPRQAAECP